MTTLGILMSNLRLPSSSGPLSSSQGHLYTSLASALVFSMPCAPTVGPLPFSQRPLPFSPTCVFFFCSFFVLHIFPHVIPNEREKESACSGAAVFGHAPARTTLVVLRSHEVERFQILVGEHNKELTGGKGQDRGYWRIKRVLE